METSIIFLAQSGPVGNHRTRTHPFAVVLRSTTAVPVEHLQTIQSGVQITDWEDCRNAGSNWFKRNDSDKAQYVGSAANLPLKRRLQKKVGLCDFRKIDVSDVSNATSCFFWVSPTQNTHTHTHKLLFPPHFVLSVGRQKYTQTS